MRSYGELQDETATALAYLLASTDAPISATDLETIAACQVMLRSTLADRLSLLGAGDYQQHRAQPPALALARLVDQLPGPSGFDDDTLSPLDALQPHATGVLGDQARWWQIAAGSALQATEALAGDADLTTWLRRDESLWLLVGDATNTIEALAVLDQDLVAYGLAPGRAPDLDGLDALRQQTSYTARMATWYGTDASADLATRGRGQAGHDWQVRLVRDIGDLEPAQRRLGDYFRLLDRVMDAGQVRVTRSEAVTLVATQRRVVAELLDTSRQALGDGDETTRALAVLGADLAGLQPHLAHLRDVRPVPDRMNVMGQLVELNRGVARAAGRGELADLSPNQLTALAQTSRWTCARFARDLTREATTPAGNLRLDVARGQLRRATPTTDLGKALNRLVDDAPKLPGREAWFPNPTGPRARLRKTLDAAPTSRPPTRPSPTRGSDYGR